ncbi:bestrophin-like domain [Methylobacterium planeticum]|uniref:DUF4239 domain-containing protein n=1 Tax=Methylobacterium planeticum TaxID=2615211 RepID=A0A6N6MVZ8_9HYPH|nr:DUF4239 domain-containing protein [Methylobacterium planeticum]KAB1073969.1 DUF4239 domain-containing protein [Methylobacterium planeticum]
MALSLLATQPLWLSAIVLVGLMSFLAMAGPLLVRRYVSLEQLRLNNEVAGFKFATVGVLYAVLLAFAVIIVWEKFSEAENATAQEAGAIATLYRLADGIGGNPGAALRAGVTRYVRTAVAEDWPAMERGQASPAVTQALSGAYAALMTFNPSDNRGTALFAEALNQLDRVTQARRVRLVLAPGVVPRVLWFILSGGAFLTIGFTLFFGTENLRVQAMMTGILSFLIFSGLLVITTIDHPFGGAVRVQPEALAAVLEDFAATAQP